MSNNVENELQVVLPIGADALRLIAVVGTTCAADAVGHDGIVNSWPWTVQVMQTWMRPLPALRPILMTCLDHWEARRTLRGPSNDALGTAAADMTRS